MLLTQLNPSLEAAIAYQGESAFFKELTEVVAGVRDQLQVSLNNAYVEKLDVVIQRHTGLTVHTTVIDSPELNAAMVVPMLDMNNPFWSIYRDQFPEAEFKRFVSQIQRKNGLMGELKQSEMDLLNGKVTGFFATVKHDMYLFRELLERKSFTDEEIAAIVLHEVGHAFTHLEALFLGCTMNLVLDQAWRELTETTDPVQRMAIARSTAKTIGVNEKVAEDAAEAKTQEELTVRYLSNVFSDVRSTTGASKYEFRLSEFSADRFAARHGAGRHLVTILDKMDKSGWGRYQKHRVSSIGFVVGEMIKILGYVVLTTGMIIPMVILGWLGLDDPQAKIYDDPGERIDRIRAEMVNALKDRTLPADHQKRIQEDLKQIDALRKTITDRRSFYEWVWGNLTPARRRQQNQMRFQQELERLVNNDLFVKASRFNTLA